MRELIEETRREWAELDAHRHVDREFVESTRLGAGASAGDDPGSRRAPRRRR